MKKNVASQYIGAQINATADGAPVTTGTTTIYVTGDNGTQAAGSVSSGACTHKGHGYWSYAPAQAETNYDHIAYTFENSTGVNVTVQVYTMFPQTGDGYARLGAPAGASVSADIAGLQSDTDNIQTRIPAALVSGRIDASVGAMAADVITASALNATAVDEIVDATWDEVLTGGTHNIATSAGRRLRELGGAIVTTGTAQGGGTASITLAATASSTNGTYDPGVVQIVGGTGVGQSRLIIEYVGSTRVASVDRDWRTAPDSSSQYEIFATHNIISTNEGLAAGATSNTLTLNADASSIDDVYAGQTLVIRTGTGANQTRMIMSYTGSTKTVNIAIPWTVMPDTTTGYMIWPLGRAALVAFGPGVLDTMANGIWDFSLAGSPTAPVGSAGAALLTVNATTDKLDDTLEDDGGTYRFTANALEEAPTGGGGGPSAATIADAVWDELLSGHVVSGSTGEALAASGSAGDPWTTTLPGAYGAGTAGKIVGDNLNATVSSRATQTSVDDLPTNAELATALGTADDAVLVAINDLPTNAELASALGGLSIPSASTIADAVHDEAVDGATTFRESVRLQNAALAGKASGLETTTAVFRDLADTKDRITATVDASGNRTAVTRDAS